jgi:hypothetical protein
MAALWARASVPKGSSVSKRAQQANHMFAYCRVIGCGQPTRAGTAKGLDTRFCRRHADHYSRHGSPYKRSYSAKELTRYRKTVRTWLKANPEDRWVTNALDRIRGLYARSGPLVEAFRLAGMTPVERARTAWARLREASVEPVKVLEAWLVVELAVRLDVQPDGTPEFKRVQGAKLLHRLASGSHKRWEREVPRRIANHFTTEMVVTELHTYPHSRGKILRYLGRDLEEACELVVSTHIGALVEIAQVEGS